MSLFPLLDPRDEDELHKTRLLNVEEKPFKRITKRLLSPGSLLQTFSKLPTPPPDNAPEYASAQEVESQKQLDSFRQFREDILLDFAAFESSISRIQFLRNSNERERERYKVDKERILQTAQAVRDNTVLLRVELEEAKAKKAQRDEFDKLAQMITSNRLLRPRKDQEDSLKKLEEECRELERESQAYSETWKERREQFGRIVEEGMQLRRLIRDEKEEVERREGMGSGDEDGEVGEDSREGQTPKYASGNATPGPDGADGLKPRAYASGSLSRPGSRHTSRAPSPAASDRRRRVVYDDRIVEQRGLRHGELESENVADDDAMNIEPVAGLAAPKDIDMDDTPPEVETPQVVIDEPAEDLIVEDIPARETEDKMDMT